MVAQFLPRSSGETKPRRRRVQEAGFKFLGFGVSWRTGKSGRSSPPVEPQPKRPQQLRDALREKLNRRPQWRAAAEVIPEVNRLRKGWGGYFHYGHRTRGFDRMNQYVAMRVQRWRWRKRGCTQALWGDEPTGRAHSTPRHVSAADLGGRATGAGVAARRRAMTTPVFSPNARTCLLYSKFLFAPSVPLGGKKLLQHHLFSIFHTPFQSAGGWAASSSQRWTISLLGPSLNCSASLAKSGRAAANSPAV